MLSSNVGLKNGQLAHIWFCLSTQKKTKKTRFSIYILVSRAQY